MNKKFSTLLAAFLAAGYCMTAEAGIVKVTNVEAGRSYVVGETGWSGATTGKYYVKSNTGAFDTDGNKKVSAVIFTTADAETAAKFQLELVSGDTYYLKQGGNYLYLNPTSGNVELSVVAKTPLRLEKKDDGSIILWNNAKTQSLKIDNSANAGKKLSFVAGENKIDLYAYTEKLTAASNQVLKIGNKYLVVNNETDKKVQVVDEAVYQAYLTRGDIKNTLWTITASGTITSDIVNSANILQFDNTSESGFKIVATAAGSDIVFEKNNAEDLFGAWSSDVFKPLVLKSGKYALAAAAVPATDETPVKVSNSTSSVTPNLAPLVTNDGFELVDKVDGGEYYLISSKSAVEVTGTTAKIYLSQESDAKPATLVNIDGNTSSEDVLKAAYWKVVNKGLGSDNKYHYTFQNKKGVTLKVNGISEFVTAIPYAKGIVLGNVDDAKTLQLDEGTGTPAVSFASTDAGKETLGFYKVATKNFTAKQLLEAYNTYFDLTLSNKKDGATLTGNPFAAEGLVPMKIVYNKNNAYQPLQLKEATGNEDVFLLKTKNSNDYIILDWDKKWSKEGIQIHVTEGGFKFGTLTAENMLAYINKNYRVDAGNEQLAARNLGFAYQFKHAPLATDIKTISVVDYNQATEDINGNALNSNDYVKVTADDRATTAIQYPVYLTSYETDGVHYLTVNADQTKVILYASLAEPTLVHGSDAKNNPLNYGYVNIEFVNHETVTYQTEDGKTAYLNGKVLGIRRGQNGVIPAEADKFLFAKPEGQWFVKMTNVSEAEAKDGKALTPDKDIQFSFVNRENPEIVYYVDKMFALGDDTYAIQSEVITPIFNNNSAIAGVRRDTVKITNANIKNDVLLTDGYKDLNDAAIKDKQYRIVLNSTSDVNYYVSENHTGNHLLGITTKEAEAATWKLVRMDREAQYDKDGYLKEATDSIYVINKPQVYKSDKKYYQYTDTLAAVTYALKNTVSNEYLTYADIAQEKDINAMICKENSADYLTHRDDTYKAWLNSNYRFIIKEKDGELVNILGVNQSERNHRINFGNKLFGASTNNRVEIETAYTQINSNDLFRLEEVNAPEYVKSAQGEVIRLFSEDNNNDVIYENGEFLNLGNITQITDMKPALYVDTAYVERDGNNRYQYLLVVNPTRVDEVLDNANHQIHPDTTYGRFLVNLVDTAVYAYKNGAVHANKYINDKEAGEKLVKTGFVWGFRTANKLYVTEDNTFKKDEARVIDLSTSDFNVAKFAFQYVNSTNADDKSFKIQTRYVDYASAIAVKDQKDRVENNDGYLKTINGVVVVANGYAKGEVFNLSAEVSDPTANEGITASGVTVEGGNGIVTIKGAAAKKVTVCNVLGQTLATTVLTSDDATIAVPAGIVVVAVEGEAAVKAVVK